MHCRGSVCPSAILAWPSALNLAPPRPRRLTAHTAGDVEYKGGKEEVDDETTLDQEDILADRDGGDRKVKQTTENNPETLVCCTPPAEKLQDCL